MYCYCDCYFYSHWMYGYWYCTGCLTLLLRQSVDVRLLILYWMVYTSNSTVTGCTVADTVLDVCYCYCNWMFCFCCCTECLLQKYNCIVTGWPDDTTYNILNIMDGLLLLLSLDEMGTFLSLEVLLLSLDVLLLSLLLFYTLSELSLFERHHHKILFANKRPPQ